MFSFNTCCFVVCFLSMSLSATAEATRNVHRELDETAAVDLKTAGGYAILTKTGITNVPTSNITGSIGVSPIAATPFTGFSLILDLGGQFSTSSQFVGIAPAASYGGDVETNLTTAVGDMEAAYIDAKSRPAAVNTVEDDDTPEEIRLNLNAGVIGGETLTPGVYTFGTYVSIADDVYFDADTNGGDGGDVFIIQIAGYLSVAAGVRVHLLNGALAKNIFWQVEDYATVGALSHMEGIFLSKTAVTLGAGSSLNGRVLAQTACTLNMATIDSSEPSVVSNYLPSTRPSSPPSSAPSGALRTSVPTLST
jgi:hypothetical protein